VKDDETALASFLGTPLHPFLFQPLFFLILPGWGAAVLRPYDMPGKLVSP
jgi:hypothetical protein